MDIISLAAAKKFGQKANVFKYCGSCLFEELPTQDNEIGDVWNITNDFSLDGKNYDAGTNVAWDGDEWDALSASVDMSAYEEISNKVTSLSSSSTNIQYPSAKVVYDNIPNFKGFIDSASQASGQFNFGTAKRGVYVNQSVPYHFNYTVNGSTSTTYNGRVMFIVIIKEFSKASNNDVIGYTLGATRSDDGHYVVATIKKASSSGISFTESTYNPNADKSFLLWYLTGTAQNIYGVKTFDDLPISTKVPTANGQLTNKKYVDDAVETATSAQIQALFSTGGGEEQL